MMMFKSERLIKYTNNIELDKDVYKKPKSITHPTYKNVFWRQFFHCIQICRCHDGTLRSLFLDTQTSCIHRNKSHNSQQCLLCLVFLVTLDFISIFYYSFWPSCFFYLCTLLPITWSAEWTLLEGRLNNVTDDKRMFVAGVSHQPGTLAN